MEIPSSGDTSKTSRVIVVGAGLAGLVAAKTYLQASPSVHLTIIDSAAFLGGVWAIDRIYPTLIVDSPCGFFDFSDLRMTEVSGLKDYDDIPGSKVYEYLRVWTEKWDLTKRLRLNTSLEKLSRNHNGQAWDLEVKERGKIEVLTCDKVILATGLYSRPNWPDVPRKDYAGVVCHTKTLGPDAAAITAEKIENVTVYGGHKSSLEAVIMCLEAGKHVDWVIRETGTGPGLMAEVRKNGIHAAIFLGRWKGTMTPNIFAASGFLYRFLHSGKSRIGSWITRKLWARLSTVPFKMEPYKTGGANMEKLRPEFYGKSILWSSAAISPLHNNKIFNENLHTGRLLTVHRGTITSLSGTTATLTSIDGTTTFLPSDATIFATGWVHTAPFVSHDPTLAHEIGLPIPSSALSPDQERYWAEIDASADETVCNLLPVLRDSPKVHFQPSETTPFRLYRHMLPPSLAAKNDRSLIHVGIVTTLQHSTYTEIAALWAVAYLEGLLPPRSDPTTKSKRELDEELAKVNAWCRRRFPSRGFRRQIVAGEVIEVEDGLLRDLGLSPRRKGWWGIKDFLVPYRSQDYKGIVEEVLERRKKEGKTET